MNENSLRIRCVTKKCGGFIETRLRDEPKTRDGNWQSQCDVCSFWNLVGADGSVRATSKTPFDLTRLSTELRLPTQIRREPPGGV
ncbi:MAG: hypothetical protein LC659_14595 [Myxococcales bacterium]|nr:hypothetical protein [Myxococcales bacterium]